MHGGLKPSRTMRLWAALATAAAPLLRLALRRRAAQGKEIRARLAEREGILTWLVAGAKEWYQSKLRPPDSVLDDSVRYRNEQDRVKQFVADRCIIDPNVWSSYSGGDGLYPAYTQWCKESGYMTMGVNRFGGELARVVPGAKREESRTRLPTGGFKTMAGVRGLRVNTDYDGGGVAFAVGNEDLI